ncbi:hypothetical protein [Gemmatimonas aurantiaca]|uniref:hypothetical protein n=1 Tax=Gemmatimonas aurantiaca TaxID=173480 RepID=UPI00301D32E6
MGRLARGALVLGLGFVACTDNPDVAADSSQSTPSASGPVSASAATPPGDLSGQWQEGDEQIRWRAERTDGAITRIIETATFGADGHLSRDLRYTREGTLSSFSEIRTQTMQSPDRTPSPMEVRVTLEMAGDAVVRSDKLVDGKPVALRSFEIDYARRHAEQMLTVARRTP